MNKQDVVKFIANIKTATRKHSPEILTGIGIAGMVTTTILAVRATPKALILIEEAEEEKGEKLTKTEVVKAAWKPYVPATITGVLSASCLIGASSVSAKRNAALATAYKLSETALSEYKEKVIETIGEKKEQSVREKVAQDQIEKNPVSKNEIIITEKGNTLCYDYISKRYFKSDIEQIRKIENRLNKQILHDITGCVSLNEFYDELNLDRVEYGDEIGWNTDNMIDLDIGPYLAEDDTPCLIVGHHNAPKYGFY